MGGKQSGPAGAAEATHQADQPVNGEPMALDNRSCRGWVHRASQAAAGLAALLPIGAAHAAWELNMPRGVTPISREAYDQHMLMLWWCIGIGIVVFGVMFYSMIRHRRAAGHAAANFHHNTFAEILWTVVPVLILVLMAIPATRALIVMEDTSEADMTLKVTGHQWKWRYEYLEDGVDFFSSLAPESREAIYTDAYSREHYLLEVDNEVVLPVGRKVRILLTANDVIHAWWVPALGMKKDAIPGFINEIWARIDEPGVYRGQCAELCGKDHGYMPIVVRAVPQEKYAAWVGARHAAQAMVAQEAEREWTTEELMARGKKVYLTACAACHQQNGQGLPPAFPAITGSPIATGPLDGHLDRVLNGKPGTAMAAFAEQLSDSDLAAVVTFQRNALGNAAGDIVQPAAIRAVR